MTGASIAKGYFWDMLTINLFGEDGGISVLLDSNGDPVEDIAEASVRGIGHHFYCCSLEDAKKRIAQQTRERMHHET